MTRIAIFVFLFLCGFSQAQERFALYFDTNKFTLSESENKRLQEWIIQNPKVKIVGINGYTDEDGTSTHNDTLSAKRVQTLFQLVKGKIAMRDDFKTRSFGEMHQQAGDKAKNRRAVIHYLLEKDLARENEILGIVTPKKVERVLTFPKEIRVENPDGSKSVLTLDTEFMKKVALAKPGEKLTLSNLNFHLSTFAIVKDSRAKLYELLIVMQYNPSLQIEIQGHICCSQKDVQNLSFKRANAVREFLVMNDIDKSRISAKGFGVSQPLFPIPEQTEAERAANRRVEIVVVKE